MSRRASPSIVLCLCLSAHAGLSAVAMPDARAQTPANPSERAERAPNGMYERDVVEVAPATPITAVHVDNRLGNIRIEGHDSDKVVISAYKRALDQDTLDRLKITLAPDNNGPVRIVASLATDTEARPIQSGSIAIDLVILAPRAARVDARVWDGSVQLLGMENGAELTVNQGDIEVKNASGTIVTHVTSGAQTFSEVFGTVDAQSVTGRVDLHVVRGERLDASVHQGRIDGRDVRVRELSLRATKGDIHLRAEILAGGSYRVATYDGNIQVELSSSAPLSVRAHSKKGRVDMAGSLAARTGEDGFVTGASSRGKGARAVFELRSRVGNIQLAVVE
jgi:hypothetical protein